MACCGLEMKMGMQKGRVNKHQTAVPRMTTVMNKVNVLGQSRFVATIIKILCIILGNRKFILSIKAKKIPL
jgi:hypothetical protein